MIVLLLIAQGLRDAWLILRRSASPPARLKSHSPTDHQDDNDDQDDPDYADAAMAHAIAVAAKPAAKATQKKDDEYDDEDEAQRHDASPLWMTIRSRIATSGLA